MGEEWQSAIPPAPQLSSGICLGNRRSKERKLSRNFWTCCLFGGSFSFSPFTVLWRLSEVSQPALLWLSRRKAHIWCVTSQTHFILLKQHSSPIKTENEQAHTQSPYKRHWDISDDKEVLLSRESLDLLKIIWRNVPCIKRWSVFIFSQIPKLLREALGADSLPAPSVQTFYYFYL